MQPITEIEVRSATRYLPRKKSAGPDKDPNELYRIGASLRARLAQLLTKTIEYNYVPKGGTLQYHTTGQARRGYGSTRE